MRNMTLDCQLCLMERGLVSSTYSTLSLTLVMFLPEKTMVSEQCLESPVRLHLFLAVSTLTIYSIPILGVHDIHINSDNLSFTQRLHNFFQTIQLSYGISTFTESVQDVFDEKYPNFPSLTSLYQNQAYTVMNSHPLLDIQKPITAKIKQIGGIGVKKSKDKKLSKEFEEILNSGEKGTVLFSFGTFMKTKSMSKGNK